MRCWWLVCSVVVLVGACEPKGNARTPRWPHHRKQGDARFAELERRAQQLEDRVHALEAALAALRGSPAAQPAPQPALEHGADAPVPVAAAGERAGEREGVPARLERQMISDAIAAARADVAACGAGSVKGTVKLHVVVGAAGEVVAATVKEAPDAALGACVADAVRRARFAPTRKGGTFTYPFVF